MELTLLDLQQILESVEKTLDSELSISRKYREIEDLHATVASIDKKYALAQKIRELLKERLNDDA